MIYQAEPIAWAASYWLWLLPLILVGLIALGYFIKTKRAALRALGFYRAPVLFKGHSLVKELIKVGLLSIALLAVWVALLRPQWGKKEDVIAQEGRDIVIVLDISRSMLAQDLEPNRLSYAKTKIKQLVQALPTERVALILFAGSAFVYCPLTADHAAFMTFLDTIDSGMVSSGTTQLSLALEKAITLFDQSTMRRNKLVVVVTDGEDFSPDLARAKALAQAKGVKLFTLGVGTPEGAPVPLIDDEGNQIGYQKNNQGEVVISRRNDEILQAVAQESGAVYVPGTKDSNDIKQLSSLVQHFERERIAEKNVTNFHERYMYFAAIALVSLLIEWLL